MYKCKGAVSSVKQKVKSTNYLNTVDNKEKKTGSQNISVYIHIIEIKYTDQAAFVFMVFNWFQGLHSLAYRLINLSVSILCYFTATQFRHEGSSQPIMALLTDQSDDRQRSLPVWPRKLLSGELKDFYPKK